MLMSVIVDGGLYREEDFMLRGLFPDALVAQRDRFVLTVGGIMVIIACLSMACGLLSACLLYTSIWIIILHVIGTNTADA